jgi:HPt (histidine-containing phosphotransfer) domain-containing protein
MGGEGQEPQSAALAVRTFSNHPPSKTVAWLDLPLLTSLEEAVGPTLIGAMQGQLRLESLRVMQEIDTALANGEIRALYHAIHELKGMLNNLAGTCAGAIASELEDYLMKSPPPQAIALVSARLPSFYDAITATLEALRRRYQAG